MTEEAESPRRGRGAALDLALKEDLDLFSVGDLEERIALLEGEIARLASPHVTPADLTTMRRENRLLRSAEAAVDLDEARDRDRAFHTVLHVRCPNRLLVALVETAYARMDTLRNVFEHHPERIDNATAEHQRLIDVLRSHHSADEVGLAFRDHGLAAAAEVARWRPAHRQAT